MGALPIIMTLFYLILTLIDVSPLIQHGQKGKGPQKPFWDTLLKLVIVIIVAAATAATAAAANDYAFSGIEYNNQTSSVSVSFHGSSPLFVKIIYFMREESEVLGLINW